MKYNTIYPIASLVIVAVSIIGIFVKRNHILGVRTSWSFYNDVTWKKTQRTSGIITAVAGCIIAYLTYRTDHPTNTIIFAAGFLTVGIACSALSYYYYRKEVEKEKGDK